MNTRVLGLPILKASLKYEQDIVTARQKTRYLSQMLGFEGQDQARLATAVSELARNVFQYVGSGVIEFFFNVTEPQTLNIKVSDRGKGISELDDILNGTYVSKSGMGIGLIGTKKIMDFFDTVSSVENGTVVTIGKSLSKRAKKIAKEDLIQVTKDLIEKQNFTAFEEIQNQNRDLLNTLEELRTAKDELSSLNLELAETNRGVVALYAELDEKAASLQRANEVKTSFLSNMTHEFRTPLSSIISLTRILLDKLDGELTEEQERQVNYIRQAGEGLLDLVNDLLDLAKVEAGRVSVNISSFPVEDVLSGLRGMFRPIMNHHQNNVTLDVRVAEFPLDLETDQAKVSQILRNIVSNALKFTELGTVIVNSQLIDNDKVLFTVEDTGIGIDPKFFGTIFEDFGQIETHLHDKQKGTGLGLPLARKIARLLGGDLQVESKMGVGSTFYVSIPRRYKGEQEAVLFSHASEAHPETIPIEGYPELKERPESTSKFRVLIIDHDERSRCLLKNLVAGEMDVEFAEAASGGRGLDCILSWHPDVVFLDLEMPDGYEMLLRVKADVQLKDIPIVINTAKTLSAQEKLFLVQEGAALISKECLPIMTGVTGLRQALKEAGFDYKKQN